MPISDPDKIIQGRGKDLATFALSLMKDYKAIAMHAKGQDDNNQFDKNMAEIVKLMQEQDNSFTIEPLGDKFRSEARLAQIAQVLHMIVPDTPGVYTKPKVDFTNFKEVNDFLAILFKNQGNAANLPLLPPKVKEVISKKKDVEPEPPISASAKMPDKKPEEEEKRRIETEELKIHEEEKPLTEQQIGSIADEQRKQQKEELPTKFKDENMEVESDPAPMPVENKRTIPLKNGKKISVGDFEIPAGAHRVLFIQPIVHSTTGSKESLQELGVEAYVKYGLNKDGTENKKDLTVYVAKCPQQEPNFLSKQIGLTTPELYWVERISSSVRIQASEQQYKVPKVPGTDTTRHNVHYAEFKQAVEFIPRQGALTSLLPRFANSAKSGQKTAVQPSTPPALKEPNGSEQNSSRKSSSR